jgi:hypothetical protein
VLTAARVAGALVLVKAVDVATRGPLALPAAAWLLVLAAFVAGGLGLLCGRSGRGWWALVLAGAAGVAVDLPLELVLQHLVLLMGVALAAVVARGEGERLLLWRVQLSALYGFAALAKLNETYLSGDVLAGAVVQAPFWSALLPAPPLAGVIVAGIGLVVTELVLAVGPWSPRLRRPATLLAVAFHSATLLLVTNAPVVGRLLPAAARNG